jgi:hypothetical protein
MTRREINLIGGFYKDSSLPWSAQDTVNWLPVPAQESGTRSPMKLRGVPGLSPLGESVVEQLRLVGFAPDGVVGTPYSFSYAATGGTPPYTFSLASGSMPPGLTFNAGAITGTPTTAGLYPFRPKVSDFDGQEDSRPDDIEISTVPIAGRFVFFWRSFQFSPAIAGADTSVSGESLDYAEELEYGFNATQRAAASAEGTILCATDGNIILRSTDSGLTFTSHSVARAFGTDISGPVKVDGRWCLGAANTNAQYSDDDGETWSNSTGSPVRIVARNTAGTIVGFFVNSLESRVSSNGGASFAAAGTVSGTQTSFSRGIACDGTTFMLAFLDGSGVPRFSTSSNSGSSWSSPQTLPFVAPLSNAPTSRGIAAGAAGEFVIVGASGEAVYTDDSGATWTASNIGAQSITCVVYGGGRWVAIGPPAAFAPPVPYYSDDGVTWTAGESTGLTSSIGVNCGTYLLA